MGSHANLVEKKNHCQQDNNNPEHPAKQQNTKEINWREGLVCQQWHTCKRNKKQCSRQLQCKVPSCVGGRQSPWGETKCDRDIWPRLPISHYHQVLAPKGLRTITKFIVIATLITTESLTHLLTLWVFSKMNLTPWNVVLLMNSAQVTGSYFLPFRPSSRAAGSLTFPWDMRADMAISLSGAAISVFTCQSPTDDDCQI